MSGISTDQEQHLKDLIAKGNKIAAIALYREWTGVSLKEAKDAVEALPASKAVNFSNPIEVQGGESDFFLENRIKRLLTQRKKIEAVKVYREAKHCGLKEAKDAVDLIQAEVARSEFSNAPNAPAISNDPFAGDAQETRRRLVAFAVLFLLALGGLAFFYLLFNGV